MTASIPAKTVILDLGNVVLDWNIQTILDSLEVDSRIRLMLHEELFAHPDWLDMDHGKKSETSVTTRVCDRSELNREQVESALWVAKNSLRPISDTLRLMREFSERGIPMICLSNMSRETYAHISENDFFDLFQGIVISAIEGCMKPGEDIFRLTIDRFDLRPSKTLFIDDSLANVETAQRLGIDGFHFRRSQACYHGIRELLA